MIVARDLVARRAARAGPERMDLVHPLDAHDNNSGMTKTIRILLLEDSDADGELIIAQLTTDGMNVVAERVDSEDAYLKSLRDFAPDVVLCDHGLRSFNARGALELLRSQRPGVPLIVVTGEVDERQTVEYLRAGAENVLLKSHLDRLTGAVDGALAIRSRLGTLTPRQLEVLQLVSEGNSTPEIARRLDLSIKTVESHRTELMRRLGIHDVVTLVRYAVRVGLVTSEP